MQALADGISQLMLHIWKASGVHRQTAGLQRVGSLSAERVRLALHTRISRPSFRRCHKRQDFLRTRCGGARVGWRPAESGAALQELCLDECDPST